MEALKKYRINLEANHPTLNEDKGFVGSASMLCILGTYESIEEAVKIANQAIDKCLNKGYQADGRFDSKDLLTPRKIQAHKDYSTVILTLTPELYPSVDTLLSEVEESIQKVQEFYKDISDTF